MERQRRSAQDVEEAKKCHACLGKLDEPEGLPGNDKGKTFTAAGVESCEKECGRFIETPNLCEWESENEKCGLKKMTEFQDIYEVHNDFLSGNVNPVTKRRGDGATTISFANELSLIHI